MSLQKIKCYLKHIIFINLKNMENTIKISVVMPVYNGEKYLHDSISSVLNQTEKNFEFVIINDGSTDTSEKVIKSFNDPRIRYINKNHIGLVEALNFGISEARGKYIARMDADDICLPNRFEIEKNILENDNNIAMVGSHAIIIDENNKEKGVMSYPPQSWNRIKKYTLLHCPFIHPTVMIRKDILEIVGKYIGKFKYIEDYDLWSRIVFKYKCVNITELLIKYRIHKKQETRKNNFLMRLKGIILRFIILFRYIKS